MGTGEHFRDAVGERTETERLGYEWGRGPRLRHMGIVAGHEQDRHLRPELAEPGRQLMAIHFRHGDITDHQIKTRSAGGSAGVTALRHRECLARQVGGNHLMAEMF